MRDCVSIEEEAMCDYSLHQVSSRPAEISDELVVSKFSGTQTRGFSAVGEPGVAVCLRPGAEIAFESDAEQDHPFARLLPKFGFGKICCRLARFRQINVGAARAHHDALEFANGKVVLITKLRIGQQARVLQLPAEARENAPAHESSSSDFRPGTEVSGNAGVGGL
jgi:hypothetical protein